MTASLLYYRPWRGTFGRPVRSTWPVARVALAMIFRRKIFWTLYALSLLIFFMFFFGQYLLAWAMSQVGEETVRVGFIQEQPARFIQLFRDVLKINGSAEMYGNFFWYQGYMVMVVLALAGSILVGNDFQFGSLPFYLSKPLGRWHYLMGKCLAVAVFINLMTTVPALVLFVQYGLLESWMYFWDGRRMALGILAYGAILTVCLSLLLVATSTWLRRTVPMIMAWATLFLFFRFLANMLVERLNYPSRWRLIDLWNDAYLVGGACLGLLHNDVRQPETYEALLVLVGVSLACLTYLDRRIRAVEVIR